MFLVLMAIATGVVVLVASPDARKGMTSRLFASTASDVITYEVKLGKLPVTVVERGGLESSKNEDVYSQVEGQTTIISIKPEGTKVKKGGRAPAGAAGAARPRPP